MNKQETYTLIRGAATQKGFDGAKEYLRKDAFEMLEAHQNRPSYGSNPIGADVTAFMKQVASELGATYCSRNGSPAGIYNLN